MLGTPFTRLTPFERLLSYVTSVRPGEGRGIALLLLQVYLLMLSYYLVRAMREAMVLAGGTPELVIYLKGTVALTLIFLIPLYKMLFDRVDDAGNKRTVLQWVAMFFAANLLVFGFLDWIGVDVAAPFYVWVGVFSVMVIAQIWAFAADLYNIKAGQRLFAVIMLGIALGAATGSQVAGRLFELAGPAMLLVAAAGILMGVVVLSGAVERSVPEGSRSMSAERPAPVSGGGTIGEVLSGFAVVARSRYLVSIALFIMLLNFVNTVGVYILNTFLKNHAVEVATVSAGAVTEGATIAAFYGNYFTAVTLIQLALQLFVVSRVFRWFGVRGAILVVPIIMVFGYGLIALVPVFALVRVLMILENAAVYSLHNTTNHALYLPVTREEKYVGKTTVDTFFYRFGDLAVSVVVFIGAQMLGVEIGAYVLLNVVLAIALLALGTAIGRHNVAEVKQKLVNLPPEASTPLPDVFVPAGQTLMFSIPDEAFMDPDPGDTLRYTARTADGTALPRWVRFDRYNQTFTVCPPRGTEGELVVEIAATDFEGLSVHSHFRIAYGAAAMPRFLSAAAASQPAARAPGAGSGGGTVPVP